VEDLTACAAASEVSPAELTECHWQSTATAAVSSVSCWHWQKPRKEKKRVEYAFRRQFNEKSSMTRLTWAGTHESPACHHTVESSSNLAHTASTQMLLLTCFLLMQGSSLATAGSDQGLYRSCSLSPQLVVRPYNTEQTAMNSAELAFNSDAAAADRLLLPLCRGTAWQLLAVTEVYIGFAP